MFFLDALLLTKFTHYKLHISTGINQGSLKQSRRSYVGVMSVHHVPLRHVPEQTKRPCTIIHYPSGTLRKLGLRVRWRLIHKIIGHWWDMLYREETLIASDEWPFNLWLRLKMYLHSRHFLCLWQSRLQWLTTIFYISWYGPSIFQSFSL